MFTTHRRSSMLVIALIAIGLLAAPSGGWRPIQQQTRSAKRSRARPAPHSSIR